jgi:phosphatidate cytidylyltransferase
LVFLNDSPTATRTIDPTAAFLYLFFTTELNDVFQFLSGKLLGRTKLAPELSPNKTLEGFLGGLVLTSLLSLVLAPLFLDLLLWQAAVVS